MLTAYVESIALPIIVFFHLVYIHELVSYVNLNTQISHTDAQTDLPLKCKILPTATPHSLAGFCKLECGLLKRRGRGKAYSSMVEITTCKVFKLMLVATTYNGTQRCDAS